MSSFSFRSGSALVASSDLIQRGNYVHQAHDQLEWFKQNISNSYVNRIFIGWNSLVTHKKESDLTHALNYLTSFIPVYSRKIFQHSSTSFWLENGKHLIVEYGAYNQNYDNSPYNTQIYYWKKESYGLRVFEDPYDNFFTINDYIEIQFYARGYTFNEIIDALCDITDYSKANYDLLDTNCQRFCQNLIRRFKGQRYRGQDYRGNHTLTFMRIPAYIAEALEENEKDDENVIGYFPIVGDVIDKVSNILD